jgi:hypothetical protein
MHEIFIITLVLGIINNILKTQNLLDKKFVWSRIISGLLFTIGLIVLIIKKEPYVSETSIYSLVVLNALSLDMNKNEEKLKNTICVITILVIAFTFIYSTI